MFNDNHGYSLADIAAASGNNRNNNGFGFDGNGAWIFLFFILILMGGWGMQRFLVATLKQTFFKP